MGDRFGVWLCFDEEEEQSDTYAEQEVGKCPECGAWLNTDALLGEHEWVRGRWGQPPSLPPTNFLELRDDEL